MNQLVNTKGLGAVSSVFADEKINNDEFGQGVQGSLAVIGYKGKVWSVKYNGQNTPLMRPDGDGPRNSIEVVLVRSSEAISKTYYEKYEEGNATNPDCQSVNGVTPDAGVPKPQSPTCANCPMNAWNSRVSETGVPGKACRDTRRIAVVPVEDIENEALGGPMLLRVPAASLKPLKKYSDDLAKLGYPVPAVVTRVAFDPQEAYPKFVFSAVRALSDEEAIQIKELRDDPRTHRIIGEAGEYNNPKEDEGPSLASVFEQPPKGPPPAPAEAPKPKLSEQAKATKPAAQRKPAPVKEPEPEPVVEEAPEGDDEIVVDDAVAASGGAPDDFESMLDNLLK